MGNKLAHIFYPVVLLIISNMAFSGKVFSQAAGSLFMLKNNFHAQLLNPSFMRTDDAIVISIAGMAGATVGNSGNFELSDILAKNSTGDLSLNFKQFYDAGNLQSSLTNWSSIPIVYVEVPTLNGRLSFYYNEKVQSSLDFSLNESYFESKNNPELNFRSFNTDDINYSGLGYKEFAVGYSQDINKKISLGIRGKILFGAALTEVEDWGFGVYENNNGDGFELKHQGTGKISLPVTINLDMKKRVNYMNSDNIFGTYLGSFQNPGLGFDLGATIYLSAKSQLAVSVTDLGGIWFRHNTMRINQDTSFVFSETESYEYINTETGVAYIDPYDMILKTKDTEPYLYRPVIDTTSFVQPLIPKTSIHYQYNISEKLMVGITEQAAFFKNSFLNIATISSLQKAGGFSIFQNVNLYGKSTLTFGGGVQWEGQFLQLFAATDNLLAVGHPTRNESFSMSFGIYLLLNKTESKKVSKGNFSPYLPFYEIKK